jgi:single-strand DNA-binding protein
MFETPLTVVGHIVNDLQRRKVGDQEVIKFRVASNSRRRTGDGSWEPGNSLFITVNCWGKLVTGVGAALGKGAPVIVVGHVYTSDYEDRDGNRRSSLEMRATSVGPDLSRAIVRIEKPGYTGPDADRGAAGVAVGSGAADEESAANDEQPESTDAADVPGSLPLSA